MNIETKLLPPNIAAVIDGYLAELYPTTPRELMVMDILVKIAQIAMFKRLKVEYFEATSFMNIYVLGFLPSGIGKDRTIDAITYNLMRDYKLAYTTKHNQYENDWIVNLQGEAATMFSQSKKDADKHIRDNAPRILSDEFSNATLEGFLALRESFSTVDWGGTFVKISEFGDFIKGDNLSRAEFLTSVIEVYDRGNSTSKVIKGSKTFKAVEGVPCSILWHTSPSGLLEGRSHDKLVEMFNRGLGRRSFVCFPDLDIKAEDLSYEEKLEQVTKAHELAPEFSKMFGAMVKHASGTYTFSTAANRAIYEYQKRNEQEALQLNQFHPDAVIAEAKNRYWKCVRLAGLIASFEHPEDSTVSESDVGFAIYITESFGMQFMKFFMTKELLPEKKLYFFIKSNPNTSKTVIREQTFVSRGEFTRWLPEALVAVSDYAMMAGETLMRTKHGQNGELYQIISVEQARRDKLSPILNFVNNPK